MTELKTLKELRPCYKQWGEIGGAWRVCGEQKLCSACNSWIDLRDAAIEWAKKLSSEHGFKDEYWTEEYIIKGFFCTDHASNSHVVSWIKHFFNITKEDLK